MGSFPHNCLVFLVDPQFQVTGNPSFHVVAQNAQSNSNVGPLRGGADHQIQFKFSTAGGPMVPAHGSRGGCS